MNYTFIISKSDIDQITEPPQQQTCRKMTHLTDTIFLPENTKL